MTKHIEVLKDKHKCSGCTACMAICPKQCITMSQDEEGFMYPIVDDKKCIDCGLCEKNCPFIQEEYKRPLHAYSIPKVFAAKHKQDIVRMSSTVWWNIHGNIRCHYITRRCYMWSYF